MKEKIIKIFLYSIIFSCFSIGIYAKGTLKISTQIVPEGKVKKYIRNDSLLIDAGILNGQSNAGKIRLAKVTVDMVAEATEVPSNNLPGIAGDFNAEFSMTEFMGRQNIPLTSITRYKGGAEAKMTLKIEELQINTKTIINIAPNSIDQYLFVAHQNEASQINNSMHALQHLNYTFILSLEVEKVNNGDIIRSDVKPKDNAEGITIGNIQDIVREQFYGIGNI